MASVVQLGVPRAGVARLLVQFQRDTKGRAAKRPEGESVLVRDGVSVTIAQEKKCSTEY